jgi:hypothetical protein|tara:strand:+ start:289 stop:531 length:243 start_codon:yes stop_codon:yes gene_type:complete
MAEPEATEKPVLTFNDKNYVIDDLSEQARYCVAQIQDLDQQISQTRARLDQLEVAKKGFTQILKDEVEEEPPAEEQTEES